MNAEMFPKVWMRPFPDPLATVGRTSTGYCMPTFMAIVIIKRPRTAILMMVNTYSVGAEMSWFTLMR